MEDSLKDKLEGSLQVALGLNCLGSTEEGKENSRAHTCYTGTHIWASCMQSAGVGAMIKDHPCFYSPRT